MELGADRHQITLNVTEDGSCSLDCDCLSALAAHFGKRNNCVKQHWFSAGQYDVIDFTELRDDFIDSHHFALWLPTGVGSVAPDAPEIAAGEADESGWNARVDSFALNRMKNLGDFSLQTSSPEGPGDRGRKSPFRGFGTSRNGGMGRHLRRGHNSWM